MSVTTIVQLSNYTPTPFWVVNWENLTDTLDVKGEMGLRLEPGAEKKRTIWIPWAWDEQTFLHGSSPFRSAPSHITVYSDSAGKHPVFSMFQHGELVEVAPGERWPATAFTVMVDADAGGDRYFSIQTAAWAGSDLLPFWPALTDVAGGHVGPPGS